MEESIPVPPASVETQSIDASSVLAFIGTAVVNVTNGSGKAEVISAFEANRTLSVKSIWCGYKKLGCRDRPEPAGGLNLRDAIEGPISPPS